MPTKIDDELVRSLYAAASGGQGWPTALQGLAAAFGAMVCQLIIVDKRSGQLLVSEQPDGMVTDGVVDYIREYHKIDPHGVFLSTQPVGYVLNTAETFPRQTMLTHRFYSEFWNPYGVRQMLGSKIGEDDNRIVFASIIRGHNQPAFADDEIEVAGRYINHLVVAFRVSDAYHHARTSATVGERLLQTADRPMFLVDPVGLMLGVNPMGRRLLDDENYLRERLHKLEGTSPIGQQLIQNAIFGLHGGSLDRVSLPRTRLAIRLPGVDGDHLLCTLWDMTPESTMGAFGSKRVFLLSAVDPKSFERFDMSFVAAMFDLTPAEAKISCLLAEGLDVSQIAEAQGVSIGTVRTQLHAAFLKTATNSQTQLVSTILSISAS